MEQNKDTAQSASPAAMTDERILACFNEHVCRYFETDEEIIEFARALLAAYASPGKAEAERWQPIETAPKDGTEIWAFSDGEQVRMQWISGDGYALWSYADPLLSDVCPEGGDPTHWMPLPSPPKS